MEAKKFTLFSWIFVVLGLVCMFICPAFVQPWGPVTQSGVTVLFVFLGTLLLVIGSDSLIWPFFLAMFGLVVYGFVDGTTAVTTLFANSTAIMMLGVFVLCWALNDSGFGFVVARYLLTRRALKGRPMLFTMTLFLAMLVMAIFTSVFGALMFGLPLVKTICRQAGYDTDSAYYKACQLGVYMFSTMGCMFFPFSNGMVLASLTSIGSVMGASVSTVAYTVSGLVVDVVFILLYTLLMRFGFRIDMSKMGQIDANSLDSMGEAKVTKRQIVLVVGFLVAALYSFVVVLIPSGTAFYAFFNGISSSLWFCLIAAILCIVPMDGKPLINIRLALKEGVDWNTLFAIGGFMMLSNYMVSDECGISGWLAQVFQPILGSIHNVFLLMLVVCLATILISNFFSNMMTAIILGGIVGPFVSQFGDINPTIIMAAIVFCAWNAFMTAAANGTAPILLGYEGIDTKFIWSKGLVTTLLYAVVAALLFTLLAMLF